MINGTILRLSKQYPQILLPIKVNEKDTPEYKNAVLRGIVMPEKDGFLGSDEDSLTTEETPVGCVDILYLANRTDFVHALQALAYRCEPMEIPASVGASTIRGLINWEKIHNHKAQYFAAGGTNWNDEFRRFTADKTNYLDTIILLSKGEYSAVPACEIGLSIDEWIQKSFMIRKYHELTHYICRTLCPKDVVPIRDEVIADMIGLVAAFGNYNPAFAKRFLGVENDRYIEGGRLSHYVNETGIEKAITDANELINTLAKRFGTNGQGISILDCIQTVIQEYYKQG